MYKLRKMAVRHTGAIVALLLFCLLAVESTNCPEDSIVSDDGECKCVSPCPKHDCQPGQQPVRVRDAIPERPGSCCPLYECHNQATLSWMDHEDNAGNQMCIDALGQPHDNGERWQDVDDPCINCTCESGIISCHTTMCRSCIKSEPRLPGECCPRCQNFPEPCPSLLNCHIDCEFGFNTDKTGCKICQCRSRSQNEIDNAEYVCPSLANCNLTCEHNLLMDENDCSICQCRPHSKCPENIVCKNKCPQGYRTDRRTGCPICQCQSECIDEYNITHIEGTTWSRNPCRSCACDYNGQIICNETVCSIGCNDPLPPPPGKCCPICPMVIDETRGWGTIPIVLIVVLSLLCVLLMVHLVRNRFRARLAPSEADFTAYPQQYYKCVPIYDPHGPGLQNTGKIAPL